MEFLGAYVAITVSVHCDQQAISQRNPALKLSYLQLQNGRRFKTRESSFTRAIPHHFCIFNGKFPKKMVLILQLVV